MSGTPRLSGAGPTGHDEADGRFTRAIQQRNLLVEATILMLLIIIPVMVTIAVFAWRYRQSNTAAVYEPDWNHSTYLELMI